MKRIGWIVGLALLGGCGLMGGGGPETTEWETELQSQAGFNGFSGDVEATAGSGQTMASITLEGGTAGAAYPWHIHVGSCGSGGGIVGPPDAYSYLRPGNDPQARSTANLNLELSPGGDYYVDVHRSPEDLGSIVACGNLRVSD